MPKAKLNTSDLALYICPNMIESSRMDATAYGVFTMHIVRIRENGEMVWLDDRSRTNRMFRNATFRAQWHNSDAALNVYGSKIRLTDIGSVERVEEAEDLVDALKLFRRCEGKIGDDAKTFGEFAQAMCKAMKITQAVFKGDDSFSRTRVFSIDSAANVVDTVIEEAYNFHNRINKRAA